MEKVLYRANIIIIIVIITFGDMISQNSFFFFVLRFWPTLPIVSAKRAIIIFHFYAQRYISTICENKAIVKTELLHLRKVHTKQYNGKW